jgi:hypothetical protein
LVNGSLTIAEVMTPKRIERFWRKIERAGECHPWRGGLNNMGYGVFQGSVGYVRFSFLAHRIAWALAHNTEPGKLQVRHSCDNPPCCNPLHLHIGTAPDNRQDAFDRGRLFHPDDPFLARGKLGVTNAADFSYGWRALAISMRYDKRQPIAVIAAHLGCHRSTLSRWFKAYEAALLAGHDFILQPWRSNPRSRNRR